MTTVYFSFDTEDFTSDHASDAVRDEANLLHEYGIRGNFNVVGYLARELVRNRRTDVLDALNNHTISFHSLRHSYHPTINEYTDLESYDDARAALELQEGQGFGMVKAVCGVDEFPAAVPPGNSISYVAMYTYADWGIPLYLGSLFSTPHSEFVYFCNALHTSYDYALEEFLFDEGFDAAAFLDTIADRRSCVLYNHPNMVLYKRFWDGENYAGANLRPMHDWIEPPRRSEEETARYYANLRRLIAALQADDRFTISSIDELAEKATANIRGRTVNRDQLSAIRDALAASFRWVTEPAELSVADCFFAAKHFLDSDEPYHPGRVHGFLQAPEGVSAPVTLTADEVRRLAAMADPAEFLPPYFEADGKRVGPADLLFAMLDVAMGAETVTVTPKPQQCDYEAAYPSLKDTQLAHTWLHADSFEDRYLSDRLRLQAWTIRPEL